jgi:hypothetical protein
MRRHQFLRSGQLKVRSDKIEREQTAAGLCARGEMLSGRIADRRPRQKITRSLKIQCTMAGTFFAQRPKNEIA